MWKKGRGNAHARSSGDLALDLIREAGHAASDWRSEGDGPCRKLMLMLMLMVMLMLMLMLMLMVTGGHFNDRGS